MFQNTDSAQFALCIRKKLVKLSAVFNVYKEKTLIAIQPCITELQCLQNCSTEKNGYLPFFSLQDI